MSKKTILLIILILIINGFYLSFINIQVQAAGYEIQVAIPGTPATAGAEMGLISYVQQIYIFALSLVGVAALVSLVIAGFRYMLSDTIDSKDAAKKMIWSALSGLILALAAYLILHTINPDLVNWKIILNR